MHDIRQIRDNPAAFDTALARRGLEPVAQSLVELDERRRALTTQVQEALATISRGGFAEAVIRMLVLLAETRGTVRRDRLERSAQVLTRDEPFRSLKGEQRAMIIHEQSLVANYGGERAITTLEKLLRSPEERALASRIVRYIVGSIAEMSPDTLSMLQRFHSMLHLPPVTDNVLSDPLADTSLQQSARLASAGERPDPDAEPLEEIAPLEDQTQGAAVPAISPQLQGAPARRGRTATRRAPVR